MPDMVFVDSSNIEAIGYDETSQELHVQFLSGSTYVYYDVPSELFDAFVAAPSKGSFLNREIKEVFRYARQ